MKIRNFIGLASAVALLSLSVLPAAGVETEKGMMEKGRMMEGDMKEGMMPMPMMCVPMGGMMSDEDRSDAMMKHGEMMMKMGEKMMKKGQMMMDEGKKGTMKK
jgi:hypothetical protein